VTGGKFIREVELLSVFFNSIFIASFVKDINLLHSP
jgi:hypothetical protein